MIFPLRNFEIEYKYLKAVIEGGLEKKPDNILIYATSNRRHLVREKSGDKLEVADDEDLHSSDTVQEKLSLVYRFGVRIYFGAPNKKEFQNIVTTLAERYGVTMPAEELLMKQTPGSFLTAVSLEERRSSLLIMFWEQVRNSKRIPEII